jgi:S1-C subfamily serine protease
MSDHSPERSFRDDPLRKSVVKLFTVTRKRDYYQPWSFGYERQSGGSACIVEGNRILTNAHVVTNAVYIQALKAGDVRKYTARVEHVSHDEELALLTVDEPGFFEGTLPVSFGELPFRQDTVRVYGFPIGGNELCVTEGVISRIELVRYTHSARELLALQTDAAINPGNSGGPVFMDGRLVGVAFQSHNGATAQSTGYVVPMPVVNHFRREVAQGACLGVPALGAFWQRIESEALREYVALGSGQTGVLLTRIVYGGSSAGTLREGDVLMSVDGHKVENDGSVHLRGDDRVGFSHFVSQHRVGETVELELLREGTKVEATVTLKPPAPLVSPPHPERVPSYFLFAGLMFVPLTAEYVATWDWKDVDARFKHLMRNELPSAERKEIVLLSHVLAHAANAGYHQLRGAVVQKVNGVVIRELKDLVKATAHPKGGFHVIEIDNHAGDSASSDFHSAFGTHVVLRAADVEGANAEILKTYGVTRERSADLDGL